MSNKFFHLALSAIAPLAVISTVAFASPAVALPEIEVPKTTAVHPDSVTPSAVNSNTNPSTKSSNTGNLDRSAKAANSQTNPDVSRGITLTISPEALIIAIITMMFIAGAVSHRKYKRQRVLTLQEQIQLLEKIWRMTPQR
ncbi:MAG: hypothetical protein HC916_13855 [Coleofasciculaceae cyanobacterium SM2_1_6]|nr:hypothetical protein [Coleofasciculaceae cyanobacterium SM2_1_6]